MMNKLVVLNLHPDAKIPQRASNDAACFDLVAVESGMIAPRSKAIFGTGLAFAVPKGFAMMVYSRSGMGFNSNVRLSNCVGVIDSDYRGEVRVALHNDGMVPYEVKAGDRIAQAMLTMVPGVDVELVSALEATQRGAGGFGSTGA